MDELVSDRNDVAVIKVTRDFLDASNAQLVKQEILSQLEGRTRAILDLSQVNFVDSAGLSGLLSCLRQVTEAGGDLKLCGITEEVRILFDLIRMNRLFEIFGSKDEAVLSYQSQIVSSGFVKN